MTAMRMMVVDDSPFDRDLISEALSENNFRGEVIMMNSGEEALFYLSNSRSGYLPNLILLDLNMPGMKGIEVLRELKTNQKTMTIPVVIFSTSDYEQDIVQSFEYSVNSYIRKPEDYEGLCRTLKRIISYWFDPSGNPTSGTVRA